MDSPSREFWPGFCSVCRYGPQRVLTCKFQQNKKCGVRRIRRPRRSLIGGIFFLLFGLTFALVPTFLAGGTIVSKGGFDVAGLIVISLATFAFFLFGTLFASIGTALAFGLHEILQPVDQKRVAECFRIGPFVCGWQLIDTPRNITIVPAEEPCPAFAASIAALEPGKGAVSLGELWAEARAQLHKKGEESHRTFRDSTEEIMRYAMAACLEQGWLVLECAEVRLSSYWLVDDPVAVPTYYLRLGKNARQCVGEVEKAILGAVSSQEKSNGGTGCGLGATLTHILTPFEDEDKNFFPHKVLCPAEDEAVNQGLFEKVPGSFKEMRMPSVQLRESRAREWLELKRVWDVRQRNVFETEPAFWLEWDDLIASKTQARRKFRFRAAVQEKHRIHERRLVVVFALLLMINIGIAFLSAVMVR